MATLVRWEPFRELATLQSEMSRFMNGLTEGNGRSGQTWVPPLDVWETEQDLVYAFDLPGIPQGTIDIQFEDGTLTVTAERSRAGEVERERLYRFERRFGTFSRTIALPQGIDESAIRAEYRDGVLEIHVDKPEQAKPRRISIGVSSDEPHTIEGESSPTA
jgi:HSP20 family protein